ncbi:hypothetical protein [Salinibacterium sp. GXW1014]|uniref:hypothetical protein n=1 Tax=Salinibacterium sp. GXW1014 TaxID=3377838 RepID=UPI00383BAC39
MDAAQSRRPRHSASGDAAPGIVALGSAVLTLFISGRRTDAPLTDAEIDEVAAVADTAVPTA